MHGSSGLCNRQVFHQQPQPRPLPDHCQLQHLRVTEATVLFCNFVRERGEFAILQSYKFFDLCPYLILNLLLVLEMETSGWFSLDPRVVLKKSSTGVANTNSTNAETSRAPVPSNVCLSILITGFT